MTLGPQEVLTRDRFYEEHRLHPTMFEIARDVAEVLAGGSIGNLKRARPIETARLLFPQDQQRWAVRGGALPSPQTGRAEAAPVEAP